MTIAEIEQTMRARAPQFRPLNARVRFVFDREGSLLLDATRTPVSLSHEDGEVACTIRISLENMGKLLTGKLDPMLAFTLGKLKVDGSKGIAMKLGGLLDG
ncbi:MAG TPA: SCP2 sterol-binding domain-containing protein [Azospirillaceae bacterium]|nr:SCP2 sterol-binding domain-containing protein [Azospirillaceae bacterium]